MDTIIDWIEAKADRLIESISHGRLGEHLVTGGIFIGCLGLAVIAYAVVGWIGG